MQSFFTTGFRFSPRKQIILRLILSLGSIFLIPFPGNAAEQIDLNYGPLGFSLSVESLEIYAKKGTIRRDLADYTRFLNSQQLEALQQLLVTRAEISPITVSQFLYSPQGVAILNRVGEVIQTQTGQSGFFAIRSALILAAADEDEGLTPLNILKKFPSQGIRINSEQGFEIIEQLNEAIAQTGRAIQAVEEQASLEVSESESLDLNGLPNITQEGGQEFSKQSFELYDRLRNRTIPVDLYLPSSRVQLAPLIVISHGLGSDRTTFNYFATYLASHGFAVAVPEHPGSNSAQIEALMNGLAQEVTSPRELVDRPWDIQYLLDDLEKRYSNRINIKQVGILGQSFGAYTALALAGAKFNIEQLERDCQGSDALNISFLIQCQGKDLLRVPYDLRDERIAAVIAINPLTSTIFGQQQLSQLQVPIMIISGSADTVTPALTEQISPFTWLTIPQKYLLLLKGGTHFSTLDESAGSIPVPSEVIGPDPTVAQTYTKILGLAFFKTYINQDSNYHPYLSAKYGQSISQSVMPLSLIQSLTAQQLERN